MKGRENVETVKDPDEDVYYEDFYCQVCSKEFKSEGQLKNHQNSKAHKKKLKSIYEECMTKEELQAFKRENEILKE